MPEQLRLRVREPMDVFSGNTPGQMTGKEDRHSESSQ
jgi:hypothetical protein